MTFLKQEKPSKNIVTYICACMCRHILKMSTSSLVIGYISKVHLKIDHLEIKHISHNYMFSKSGSVYRSFENSVSFIMQLNEITESCLNPKY